MGRPSKLTPSVRDAICKHIEEGNFPETAAKLEGISSSAFYNWMQRGRAEPEGPYAEFVESVTRAEAVFESEQLKGVRDAIDRDGNKLNGKWLLERRNRDRWGQKIDVQVRDAAVSHILDALREGLDQAAFARVLDVLSGEGCEGGEG